MEITSCQLLAYRKKQDANVVPPIVAEDHDLLRPTEKPVVMNPLEGTDSPNNYRYQIMIKANSDLSNASVSLNEIEDINLEFDNETSGTYCYKSPLQQYKDFLGQNLGYYSLIFNFKDEKEKSCHLPLRPIINKQTIFTLNQMDYLEQTIVNSEFFRMYILEVEAKKRANAYSDISSLKSKGTNYFLKVYLYEVYLQLVKDIVESKQPVLSNARQKSGLQRYSSNTDLASNDIDWLMQNPQNIIKSYGGDFRRGRTSYTIQDTQVTTVYLELNIYENRLILSCLLSMAEYFAEEIKSKKGATLFIAPIQKRISELESYRLRLSKKFRLIAPQEEKPRFSHMFTNSPFYMRIFEIISNWYTLKDNTKGASRYLARVPPLPEIFEYYCVTHIIQALISVGFEIKNKGQKKANRIDYILLQRGIDESVFIYYEPNIIKGSGEKQIECIESTHKRGKRPDIVVSYTKGELKVVGIFDPKCMSNNASVEIASEDIFSKYALYFLKEDGSPLNYVCSIHPGVEDQDAIPLMKNHREGKFKDSVHPFLGQLRIPMEKSTMDDFYHEVVKHITNAKLNLHKTYMEG